MHPVNFLVQQLVIYLKIGGYMVLASWLLIQLKANEINVDSTKNSIFIALMETVDKYIIEFTIAVAILEIISNIISSFNLAGESRRIREEKLERKRKKEDELKKLMDKLDN